MSSSRKLSRTSATKVAFLGPLASYSHQAALKEFPPLRAFEIEPRGTFKDIFEAVQNEEVVFGVVPFENSSHGSVVQTLDLFSDRSGQLPDIHVCGEIFVDIEHCLLGFESGVKGTFTPSPGFATPTTETPSPVPPRSHPLSDISHIKHIYSHPQAFGQSSAFINTYLRNAEVHDVTSTSKGAEIVSYEKDSSMAAIASESAASVLGLKVLARAIQDLEENTTRFFVIKKGSSNEAAAGCSYFLEGNSQPVPGTWKSLIGFGIDHRKAGALADALNVFKSHELNLTSINSRPSHRRPWHYIFLVEFEGKVDENESGKSDKALKDLKQFSEEVRWFGSWKNKNRRPSQ